MSDYRMMTTMDRIREVLAMLGVSADAIGVEIPSDAEGQRQALAEIIAHAKKMAEALDAEAMELTLDAEKKLTRADYIRVVAKEMTR